MTINKNDPAHFDPTLEGYTGQTPFKFWCQKVLPLVYDDSLSYYETLCKVTNYLNNVIADVASVEDNVEALHTAYTQLQNYVNTYFDSLDVQEEINNKLDVMALDGTLSNLIRTYIDPLINVQNQRITTLEERMNSFARLEEGSTTGDAELIDIRVGNNGITYLTAGEAVRSQFEDVKVSGKGIFNPSILLRREAGKKEFHVKIGEWFTVSTVDKQPFSHNINVRFYDENQTYLDVWYVGPTWGNSRRIRYSGIPSDAYYIEITGFYLGIVRVEVEASDAILQRVTRLESNDVSILPSYYDDYLAARLKTLQGRDEMVGNEGDSIIFITDTHLQNAFNSPTIIKQIMDKTATNKLVHGGDLINEPTSLTQTLSQLWEYSNKFRVNKRTNFVTGNHDNGNFGGASTTIDYSTLYGITTKKLDDYINTKGALFYHFNNDSQKIKYFILNTYSTGELSYSQLQMVRTELASLSAAWTVAFFMHEGIYTQVKDDRTNILKYSGLQQLESVLAEYVNVHVAFIMCGHNHMDISLQQSRYPIICTTCDGYGIQASAGSSDNRSAGTINEQAFDVVHIDKRNKRVYCTRIGGGQYNVMLSGPLTQNDRTFTYQ